MLHLQIGGPCYIGICHCNSFLLSECQLHAYSSLLLDKVQIFIRANKDICLLCKKSSIGDVGKFLYHKILNMIRKIWFWSSYIVLIGVTLHWCKINFLALEMIFRYIFNCSQYCYNFFLIVYCSNKLQYPLFLMHHGSHLFSTLIYPFWLNSGPHGAGHAV